MEIYENFNQIKPVKSGGKARGEKQREGGWKIVKKSLEKRGKSESENARMICEMFAIIISHIIGCVMAGAWHELRVPRKHGNMGKHTRKPTYENM